MKQLLWKEWYEMRLLPLGAAAIFMVLELSYLEVCRVSVFARPDDFTPDASAGLLWVTWSLFALLAGAGLISQEVGAGTISFLLSLPRSRWKVWLIKAGTAVGITLASVICSAIAYLALGVEAFDTGHYAQDVFNRLFSWDAFHALEICVGSLAAAVAVSALVDRYVSALMLSLLTLLLVMIAISAGLAYYSQIHSPSYLSDTFAFLIVGACIPAFFLISYVTFTRGESLRSNRRLAVAGITAAICLIFVVLFIAATYRSAVVKNAPSISYQPVYHPPNIYVTHRWGDNQSELRVVFPSKDVSIQQLVVVVDGRPIATQQVPPALRNAYIGCSLKSSAPNADSQSAQHPQNITYTLHLANQSYAIPLHFARGGVLIQGAELYDSDVWKEYADRQPITLMDRLIMDQSMHTSPTGWDSQPNDPQFFAPFAPGWVHRITVQATYGPSRQ